ncbi:MAG: 50S ribosomal protein L24 [Bacteroidota bacterium]
MAKKFHIKKGDMVRVLSGKDRGAEGRVMVMLPKENKAIVEGVRIVHKHTKPNQANPEGGIIETEAPIHLSNLMLIDPTTKQPTRVGRKKNEEGKGWVRYSKKSGELIE